MSESKYAFQAGLFILLSIAAGVLLVARVAESRNAPSDAKQYTAVFAAGEDIAGLGVGAEVRLLGVKVGRVDSVEVVTPTTASDDASIHVGFSVGDGVELRELDPTIELQTAVTGGAWLNILAVGTGDAVPDGGEIDARTSNLMAILQDVRDEVALTLAVVREDLDVVSTELVNTAERIETTADDATKLIAKIDQQVDEKVDPLLTEATGVMTDIRAVFGDSGDDIRTTLAKLGTLTSSLDTQLPESIDQINAFVTKAEASIEGIDQLMAEVTDTARQTRSLIADNRPDIDRLIESGRRSIDELEGLVDDLRANPSRLIWPPDEKDLNNLDLYATARTYAKAAEDLESAAAALQSATEQGEDDPIKLESLRRQLLQQFEYFDKLQEELWERFEK